MGNANYLAAPLIGATFEIGKATQTVSFGALPVIVVGGTGAISATATSGLAVGINSTTPSVCTVSNGIVTGVATGICIIRATQGGNFYDYFPAASVTQSFNIGVQAAPAMSLAPISLIFASQNIGAPSVGQAVTLSNSGTGPLSIAGISTNGDFAQTNNCGASIAVGANCAIALTFIPTATGTRIGTLSIASNAAGSPHSVSLNGTGTLAVLNISLGQGWNLLGNSLNQPISVATLFGDPNVVSAVWKWDSAIGHWQFFTPMMDAATLQAYVTSKGYGVLSQVGPGEGYWANAKLAATLAAQTGSVFALNRSHLVAGWNLVATGQDVSPTAFNQSLSDVPPAPGIVPQNLTSLWAWDNPANGWYFYAPGLEVKGGTALTDYIAVKGYRDFTQHNKTLGNGTGFWVSRP